MTNDPFSDRFRPLLGLHINHKGTWKLIIAPLGGDDYSEFYFSDDDLMLIPALSKANSDYPFLQDIYAELNTPETGLFQFIKQVFEETGLTIPGDNTTC